MQRAFNVAGTPVNDPPTLNVMNDITILEDATQQTVNLAGITNGPNETGQVHTVTASSSNTGLIPNPAVTYTSPNATGSIAFSPVANQNGSATITVTVTDNGGTANGGVNTFSRMFTVNVTPVNDAPTLSAIANPAAILEDAGQQTVNFSGVGTGAPNETQALSVTATSNNTALIPTPTVTYTSRNATGSLSYTPVANANGSAIITVTATDDGSNTSPNVNSFQRQFTVNVTPVNDAPTITGQMPVSTSYNTARTIQFSDLQVIDVDNTYSTGFSLTVSAGANYSLIGNTVTPANNFFGTLAVPVKVNDGALHSNTYQLAMTVNPDPNYAKSHVDIGKDPGGYKISFIGNPGAQYTVQWSASLVSPSWQTLELKVAQADGTFFSIDNPPADTTTRIYRAIIP